MSDDPANADRPILRLALAQMRVDPGRPQENIRRAADWVARAASSGADIVLLPEVLDCGWTHPSARSMAGSVPGGEACEALRDSARRERVMICAGVAERCGDRIFNSAVLAGSDGRILLHHRKLHEIEFARALYSPGDRIGVAETRWGRLGVMICADAFATDLPVSRAMGLMGARLVLSPCAWAVPPGHDNSSSPYGALWSESYGVPAREFGMTIAGCSNVGPVLEGDWKGWSCIGCSMVVGPGGRQFQADYAAEDLAIVKVSLPPTVPAQGNPQ